MRHRKAGRKLDRPTDQRMALLRCLVCGLLWHGHIETTETRAKSARALAEKIITLTKQDTVHARRQAREFLLDRHLVKRLFDEIGPKYRERPGGYSRIIRRGFRRGDAAPLARLELVDLET